MLSREHKKAVLALIISNIIWGAASPVFKIALLNLAPFTLAYIRFVGAAILILPFCYKNLAIAKKDWVYIIASAVLGITVNISFFFWGLELSPSINAPIISSAGPIFIYFLSLLFLKDKSDLRILLGMTLGLIGVVVIIGSPVMGSGLDKTVIGNIFFMIATLGSVGYTILAKKLLERYHSSTVTFWMFTVGSLTFLPFFLRENLNHNYLLHINSQGWLGIIFGVFLSSALAYFIFDWGLGKVSAAESGLFTYIDPLAAIIIAVPFLGEQITPLFIAGSILIFGGIFIAEGRLHYHPLHKLVDKN